jgi:hypothetical protein
VFDALPLTSAQVAGRDLSPGEFGVYNLMRDTQDNSRPADWVDLVTRIRAGDVEADLRLGDIFQGGIRFFLRQALGQHELESRQKEVLSLIIQGLRESAINNPNRLASYVLTVLREYIASLITTSSHLVLESESCLNVPVGAIREMLAKIAAVDREAVRRLTDVKHCFRPATIIFPLCEEEDQSGLRDCGNRAAISTDRHFHRAARDSITPASLLLLSQPARPGTPNSSSLTASGHCGQ